MDTRKEVLLSDIGALCVEQDRLADRRVLDRWETISFETAKVKGRMLIAMNRSRPEPISFDPKLSGWYRIFVAYPIYGSFGTQNTNLKLKSDGAPTNFTPDATNAYAYHSIEEVYWKCADLTGETITVSKYRSGMPSHAALAWLRFVPMSDVEVAAYQMERARTDTKRIYATHDMHGMLGLHDPQSLEDWYSLEQNFVDSDVAWVSMENVRIFDGDPSTGSCDNFAYVSDFDPFVQRDLKRNLTPETYAKLVAYGQQHGLKVCLSMRMGAWGIEFPDDQNYFVNSFCEAHPELRCIDRDGDPVDAMSYSYPEVQEYMIEQFLWMGKTGADAVEMIFTRGVPYVLFEPPFVERFQSVYGCDPRYLPLDDARVTDLRCEVMTEFVRKLRIRLDEACGKGTVGLHARVLFSVYDSRHVAVDFPRWAREGLITGIISYPQRIRERLEGDVWRDDSKTLLDLQKYHAYAMQAERTIIFRRHDFNFMEPMNDSHKIPRGPKTQQERVQEFMVVERETGVPVFFEIMPREMSTEEYRDRALELYGCGAERISLWDTYNRAPRKRPWTMISRLGHKQELASYDSGEGTLYSVQRILKVAGKDISRYLPAWGG